MRIARVFPRKTSASPIDNFSFFDEPGLYPPEVDQVHVSVTFTADIERGYKLLEAWKRVAPAVIGGPAFGIPDGRFKPGMYLKEGYVITSRGCPNKCWFCSVWKNNGTVRELPITEGWILQDDNILACSDDHIVKVFEMLKGQPGRVELRGMEAARLKPWHVEELWKLRPRHMFFSYDDLEDLEALVQAGEMLRYADFTRAHLRCYVLIGFPGDKTDNAERRLFQAWTAGFMPCAMLYEGTGLMQKNTQKHWKALQKTWMRPAFIKARVKGTVIQRRI